VWHASVSLRPVKRWFPAVLESLARLELEGVGDATLGEWVESEQIPGSMILHYRKRLTPEEQAIVGPVIDVRGTPMHDLRAKLALTWLPRGIDPKLARV
jgi:hypothetical protein